MTRSVNKLQDTLSAAPGHPNYETTNFAKTYVNKELYVQYIQNLFEEWRVYSSWFSDGWSLFPF